jgi:ssDNA-binding Zn-finger/Zn-ribbon topoisomerase 1
MKSTGRKCPECQKHGRNGELVERNNRNSDNKFIGCSCWPQCRYNEPLDGEIKKQYKKAKEKIEKEEESNNEELDLSIDA